MSRSPDKIRTTGKNIGKIRTMKEKTKSKKQKAENNKKNPTKAGYVAIVGRPNSGKSTLLNNLLGHKVSITSPKPQTTRYSIEAVLEDKRGQIIFIDTPGIFEKVKDPVAKYINPIAQQVLKGDVDVIIYIIDHTRGRSVEENKIIGLVRETDKPKILAFNKIDIKKPDFTPQYKFLEEEFSKTVTISALYKTNLNYLLDAVFELLPIKEKIVQTDDLATPLLNLDSKTFIAEIIREKAYLFMRKEIPYSLTSVVDEIINKGNGVKFIKARIVTRSDRYKKMIIGKKGVSIKEIGRAARKELETATNQKIFLDLTVEVNPHWHEQFR